MGLVDLKPLNKESVPELKYLLKNHVHYTGSTVAQRILDNWESAILDFVRIMPRDYARVLREREAREQEQMTHVPE